MAAIYELVHFSEKSGRLSSAGPEILASNSLCSDSFQPMLDYSSENKKADQVNRVVFT